MKFQNYLDEEVDTKQQWTLNIEDGKGHPYAKQWITIKPKGGGYGSVMLAKQDVPEIIKLLQKVKK